MARTDPATDRGTRSRYYAQRGKRYFDMLVASIALVVLSPLLAMTALAIWIEDRGRAVFRQERIGRAGSRYVLLKFRSMPEGTSDVPSAQAGTLNVTTIGRIIRRTNIDELPQLVNVIRGEMSLVGPRPALPAQQRLIELRRQYGALACTPGLTGLAQVRAYSGMSDEEKAAHDADYASDIRFFRDLEILFRTVIYLFRPPPRY